MSAKQLLLVIALLGIAIAFYWPEDHSSPQRPLAENHVATSSKKALIFPIAESFASSSKKATRPANTTSSTSADEIWDEAAIDSMRSARLHGDERTPPIHRDPIAAAMPTQEELDYPELYNRYETQQEVKLKTAYLAAAHPQMEQLKQQLDAMRKAGLDPAAIREGEEKLIQLQAMTKRLQEQHPELATGVQTSSRQTPVNQIPNQTGTLP